MRDVPKCDVSRLAFPSDTITLGVMRHREPHVFEREALAAGEPGYCDAIALLSIEMRVAERAFAAAIGMPDPYDKDVYPPADDACQLHEAYVEYGLSTGTNQTNEHIRRIERDAAEQAREHGGKAR